MKMTDLREDDLSDASSALRAATAVPSAGLLDRVLADALHEQQVGRRELAGRSRVVSAPGFWARLFKPFGGMPAVAGLCSAAILGLAVGYADPTTASYLITGTPDDFMTGVDVFSAPGMFATEG